MDSPAEQAHALLQMDEAVASEVLEYLEPSLVDEIFEHIPLEKAARLLQLIPADDAAQILDELDEAKAEALLEQMAPPEAREVRELLEYPENTAGRLMVRQYVRVRPDWTVEMTLDYLRQVGSEIEMLCCDDTQSDRRPPLKAHHTHQTSTTTQKLRCKL